MLVMSPPPGGGGGGSPGPANANADVSVMVSNTVARNAMNLFKMSVALL
jgi:hypothetical protein